MGRGNRFGRRSRTSLAHRLFDMPRISSRGGTGVPPVSLENQFATELETAISKITPE